jgi:hypothetical protein
MSCYLVIPVLRKVSCSSLWKRFVTFTLIDERSGNTEGRLLLLPFIRLVRDLVLPV